MVGGRVDRPNRGPSTCKNSNYLNLKPPSPLSSKERAKGITEQSRTDFVLEPAAANPTG